MKKLFRRQYFAGFEISFTTKRKEKLKMSTLTGIEITLMVQIDVRNPIDRLVVKPVHIGAGLGISFGIAGLNRNRALNLVKAITDTRRVVVTIPGIYHDTIHRLYSLLRESKAVHEIELVAKSDSLKTTSQPTLYEKALIQLTASQTHVFADLKLNNVKITRIIPDSRQRVSLNIGGSSSIYEVAFDATGGTGNLVTSG